MRSELIETMDQITEIINNASTLDAPMAICRHMSGKESRLAISALAHALVIESARRRHAEAKYLRYGVDLDSILEIK